MVSVKHELDARYLLCPMPVIKTQERVGQLAVGDELTIHCTDPGAQYDIPAWCKIHGHEMIEIIDLGEELLFRMRVGGA